MPRKIGSALLIVLGIATNQWVLEAFLVADGHIESLWARSTVIVFQLAMVSLGVWLWRYQGNLALPSRAEIVLVIVSFVLTVAVGELAAQVTKSMRGPQPAYVGEYKNQPSDNVVADPYMGWRLYPNHEFEQVKEGHRNLVRSNAQGFRSNRAFEPTPGPMIALAGDSFTWGSGVDYEYTFGHVLESEIGGPLVYNFAMPGFGVDQMWMSARHYALPLHPDLLIVSFIDDDFQRSLTAYRVAERFNKPRFVVREGHLEAQSTPNPVFLTLHAHSELFRLLMSQLRRFDRAAFDERWTLNTAIIENIAAEAREVNVPVLFIRLPVRTPSRFDRLARHLESTGVEYMDLGTPDAGLPEGMHLDYDGHLSPNGHRFVASAIQAWMTEHLPRLLDSGPNRADEFP